MVPIVSWKASLLLRHFRANKLTDSTGFRNYFLFSISITARLACLDNHY